MHSKLTIFIFFIIFLILTGCAANAKDQFAKLETGMKQEKVVQILGTPDRIEYVLFNGHDRDYEIWQYEMVPNTPLCPSEAVPRFATAMATAGLSEIIWTRAKAEPHWVYFLDGLLAYTSPAFDCSLSGLCKIQKNKIKANVN